KALNLHGLLAHWSQVAAADWVPALLDWEEQERSRRSLERRLRAAHIGRFKPICDFDWSWPKRCDRAAIEALMSLDFLREATNPNLVGPNGVGKSTRRVGEDQPDPLPSQIPSCRITATGSSGTTRRAGPRSCDPGTQERIAPKELPVGFPCEGLSSRP